MTRREVENAIVSLSWGVGIEEVTMATMVPERRSTFGTNCVRCGNELIAPEKSELRDGKYVRHLWLCSQCATCFASLEVIPVDAMTSDDIFPPLLVA
jgi:hypothetical protein